MSLKSARAALSRDVSVMGRDGQAYRFTKHLLSKYLEGKGRSAGADLDRLRHLPRAIEAIRKCSGGMRLHPGDNPPQKTVFHQFDKRHGAIVFIDAKTNEVRGFIYSKSWRKLVRVHEK